MQLDLYGNFIYPYCKRCGRKLRNAKSLKRGFGDICYKKLRGEQK